MINDAALIIIIISSVIAIFVVILIMVNQSKRDIANQSKNQNKEEIAIIKLMKDNATEMREYYKISKQQERNSFAASICVCLIGFCIYAIGVVKGDNIILYTTISGSIVQIISGLFFWLYKRSLHQLNIYHERLGITEKYLMVHELINESSGEMNEKYTELIKAILQDNNYMTNSTKETSLRK